jgi:hypothetical protein
MSGPADRAVNFKNPGSVTLRLALFWVTNYTNDTSQRALDTARSMLNDHGLSLDLWPSPVRTDATTLKFPDRLIDARADEDGSNRLDEEDLMIQARDIMADSLPRDSRPRLPLFFCEFKYPAKGRTISDTANYCWQPFCLVGHVLESDNVTLLHEVGHAAGLDHEKADRTNFMSETGPRSNLFKFQVLKLASAYFSR